MAGVEVAQAYIALTVKAPGIKKDIEGELGKVDAEGAGEKMGKGLGGGISNGQAAIAGAVGGIFASIANTAASALSDLFGEAVAASDATDKFAQTLNFAGLDTSAIDNAMSKARAYADSTVYDLSTIQNTTAQLAANGITNYSELTEAAGNLNAVAGGNADTFSSVAMMLTQTAGAGKLTTENWNQLADAIPGASGRLQEALSEAGAYTGNFRDAMAEGQITADEFNDALLSLGTEPVAVEAASSVATMEGAAGNLAASITGVLADAFTAIKPALTGFTSLLADFISNSQIFIPVIAGVGAALLVALAPALWAAVTATWAFTVALLANPLTWIVIAVGLLVAAIVALAMNWDTVVAWITEVWGGFISWITDVIDGFVVWWEGVWAGIAQFFTDFWNGIVAVAMTIWQFYIGWLIDIIVGLVQNWESIWSGIGKFFADVWNNIVTGVKSAIEFVLTTIRTVLGTIKGVWERMWQGAVDFLADVFGGIVAVAKVPINGIIGLINGAIRALNSLSISIPDWVPMVGGSVWSLSLPTIPMLAAGGTITRPGSVIVGERGPELLTLPRGASVNPDITGGGTARIDPADMRVLAAMVAQALRDVRRADGADAERAVMQAVR